MDVRRCEEVHVRRLRRRCEEVDVRCEKVDVRRCEKVDVRRCEM